MQADTKQLREGRMWRPCTKPVRSKSPQSQMLWWRTIVRHGPSQIQRSSIGPPSATSSLTMSRLFNLCQLSKAVRLRLAGPASVLSDCGVDSFLVFSVASQLEIQHGSRASPRKTDGGRTESTSVPSCHFYMELRRTWCPTQTARQCAESPS